VNGGCLDERSADREDRYEGGELEHFKDVQKSGNKMKSERIKAPGSGEERL